MKIAIIHGQNHKGSSYHIGRSLAEQIAGEKEITEFFLPAISTTFASGAIAASKTTQTVPGLSRRMRLWTRWKLRIYSSSPRRRIAWRLPLP